MRVLIAENDDTVRNVIGELLQDAGMQPGEAKSYQAACQLLLSDTWDVLLADLQLSYEGTDLDLAHEAAASGIQCIVVMSGATDRRDAVEAQGLRFLAKPFHTAELLAAVTPAQYPQGQARAEPHRNR